MATARKQTRALDAIDVLTKDHYEVEELFRQYEKLTPSDSTKRMDLLRRISRELSIHAVVEEQVLYPVISESIPNSADQVNEALEEHQQVKELLASLDSTMIDFERMEPEILQLFEDVRHHVQEEEEELFPELRKRVDQSRLDEMGAAIRTMKQVAPTRPHPDAPAAPPGNIVGGLPLAVMDRARDVGRMAFRLTFGVVGFGVGKAMELGKGVVNRMTR